MKNQEYKSVESFLPAVWTIKNLYQASKHCQGCELYKCATQTVFGEGPENARLMLVGEIAGDQEDEEGRPFVGPALEWFNYTNTIIIAATYPAILRSVDRESRHKMRATFVKDIKHISRHLYK